MNDVTLIEYYRPWCSQVEKDHKHVLDQVAGDLQRSMADAPSRVVSKSTAVIQKAEYAAGCLERDAGRSDGGYDPP